MIKGMAGLALLFWGVTACSGVPVAPLSETLVPQEGEATLTDITLQQSDQQGRLLWQLQAQGVRYREDAHVALVEQLKGELYEGGTLAFQIQAQAGEVQQEAQVVILRGDITATADEMVLQGQALEWHPQAGRLEMRGGITVRHPQAQMWAQTLHAEQQTQQIRLQGAVILEDAAARVRLKTDQATWLLSHQQIQAGRSQPGQTRPQVEIEQLQGGETLARALAGSVTLTLPTAQLSLQDPAQVSFSEPMLEITSRRLVWDMEASILRSEDLISVDYPAQNFKLVAGGGSLDQSRQLITVSGGVEALGWPEGQQPVGTPRASLKTDQLTWRMHTGTLEAMGNVHYRHSSPPITLRGTRAVGSLKRQTLHISGGDVVTEILP